MLTLDRKPVKDIKDITHPIPADLQAFLAWLIESKVMFTFASGPELVVFLQEGLKSFQGKGKDKFKDVKYQPMFEPVVAVQALALKEADREWEAPLCVTTANSKFFVKVFTSVKRHLLLSFLENQYTPRKAKPKNSIVKDEALFKQMFLDLVAVVEAQLKARKFIYGYAPITAINPACNGWKIGFETDTTPLYLDPTRDFEIHCFPSTGPDVRSLTQTQYSAAVTFLLWFFRTDERLAAGVKYNMVRHNMVEHGETSQTFDQLVKSLEKKTKNVQKNLSDVCKLIPLQADKQYVADDLKGVKDVRQLISPCNRVIVDLYELLMQHGLEPQVADATLTRPQSRNTGKDNPLKARKSLAAGTVLFKTHKAEVCSQLSDMPWVELAWLLDGYLQVDMGTIKLMLEERAIKGVKKQSVLNQLSTASDQLVASLVDKDHMEITLSNLVALVKRAQASAVPLLAGLKLA